MFARASGWFGHSAAMSSAPPAALRRLCAALKQQKQQQSRLSTTTEATWMRRGKLERPIDPGAGVYAPGQTFIHSKLGCYGTVLAPLECVEVQQVHRTPPKHCVSPRWCPDPPPLLPTLLLRPTACSMCDGMVRMVNEPGLELYIGGGDKNDGHTKEAAYQTAMSSAELENEKWYRVQFHDATAQGKPGLETSAGVVQYVNGLKQFVPGLAVCRHANVQPISFPPDADVEPGGDGDRLLAEHRNINRALKRARGPADHPSSIGAGGAPAASPLAEPTPAADEEGASTQQLVDALSAADEMASAPAASKVVAYVVEEQGIQITAIPSCAGRLEPDGAYAFNVMLMFDWKDASSNSSGAVRLEDRELVVIETSGRVQVGKGAAVHSAQRDAPIVLSMHQPSYQCTMPISVSTPDATIGGFFRLARERSGARFEVPLPTMELAHEDRRRMPFGGMSVRLALNP
eukprot:gene24559-17630_t